MSSDKETTDYIELRPGDRVQVGDQWLDQFGQWHFYTHAGSAGGFVNSGVKARRPNWSAGCFDSVAREQIAYEELQPGEIIQEGDQWQNECGRWQPFLVLDGSRVQVRQSQRARRPYNITQLQDERDELKAALRESHAAHEFTMKQGLAAIAERNEAERLLGEARMERDKAWSDQKAIQAYRDTALQELAQAREASQQLLKTITDNADQFAVDGCNLQHERDEARAERDRLQEVVNNLYNEPTARQVQQMLRTWATELDWSAGCFDSVGRDEIDTIQKTLIAVMERIETMVNPEGGTDGE